MVSPNFPHSLVFFINVEYTDHSWGSRRGARHYRHALQPSTTHGKVQHPSTVCIRQDHPFVKSKARTDTDHQRRWRKHPRWRPNSNTDRAECSRGGQCQGQAIEWDAGVHSRPPIQYADALLSLAACVYTCRAYVYECVRRWRLSVPSSTSLWWTGVHFPTYLYYFWRRIHQRTLKGNHVQVRRGTGGRQGGVWWFGTALPRE